MKCLRCNKIILKHIKGYCKRCYEYQRLKKKRDILPLKKCECSKDCKTMIPILTARNKRQKYARGHYQKILNTKTNSNKYNKFYKPYYKYSNKYGVVLAHRYIYYIYLSILNNKPTYIPKNYDIHHINGNGKDNRIQNLQLVSRKEHMIIHDLFNGKSGKMNKKDMSNRICNICHTNNTRHWKQDIDGYICIICNSMIFYHHNKFFKK